MAASSRVSNPSTAPSAAATQSLASAEVNWGKAWDAFWFDLSDGSRLAALRWWVGFAALMYFLSFGLTPVRWYGDRGLISPAGGEQLIAERKASNLGADFMAWRPSLFRVVGDPTTLAVVHTGAIAVSTLFMLGVATRFTAAATLLLLLNYIHRLPMLSGNFEAAIAPLALYLVVGGSGDRWSIDARGKDACGKSWLATIALRLIQVHFTGLYLAIGLNQLSQDTWWLGDGVWLLGMQTDSSPFDWRFLRSMPLVVNGWSHLIVAFHLAFPVLVWRPSLRRFMLGLSVIHWIGLALLTGQVLFCGTMLAAGLAFADFLDRDEDRESTAASAT